MSENPKTVYLDIDIGKVDVSFGRFRLIHPRGEASMLRSMGRLGQLNPVAVSRSGEDRYEMIDGFKRLRACRHLGVQSIRARVLEGRERVLKAAMVQLNRKEGVCIGVMDEALVMQSLCRDDGLSQVEIAIMLGCDKSLVSRRIGLIERLARDVMDHVRLGLISATHGRELSRLPRGNQAAALECLLKHRLCSRETARLVTLLLERPRWEQDTLLRLPLEILEDRHPPKKGLPKARCPLGEALQDLERGCDKVLKEVERDAIFPSTDLDHSVIAAIIGKLEKTLGMVTTHLGDNRHGATFCQRPAGDGASTGDNARSGLDH